MWVFAGLNSRLKEGRIDLNKDGHVSACFDLFVSLEFGYFFIGCFLCFRIFYGDSTHVLIFCAFFSFFMIVVAHEVIRR